MLDSPPSGMAHLLLVCTGNTCRSPMAEGFLREALRRAGQESARVSSAGISARDGGVANPDAVRAAAELGVEISGHRTRAFRAEEALEADAVMAMTVAQREVLRRRVPEAAPRTFTLKELVLLLEGLPAPVPRDPVARVAAAAALRGSVPTPPDTDVPDPVGLSYEAHRAVAWELQGWCERLAAGLVGVVASPRVGPEG